MNTIALFTIYTANILGIFNDPFEFEGDYGPEANPIRQKVFEAVVAKEALARNTQNDDFLKQAVEEDRRHGPTLAELANPSLLSALKEKQQELQNAGFEPEDLDRIINFIQKYGGQKVFYFFRNAPQALLALDKILKDKASRAGKDFDLPILISRARRPPKKVTAYGE